VYDRRFAPLILRDEWDHNVAPLPHCGPYLFIMENLDTSALAAAGVYECVFVLTHHKTRGSTASGIAPAAVI
jgi:hypothetical protein